MVASDDDADGAAEGAADATEDGADADAAIDGVAGVAGEVQAESVSAMATARRNQRACIDAGLWGKASHPANVPAFPLPRSERPCPPMDSRRSLGRQVSDMARAIRTRPHPFVGTTRIDIREVPAGVRALGRTAAFILSMTPGPMPRLVARLTPDPVIDQLAVPGPDGPMTLDLYRPPTPGPHPGVLLSLGVLPLGVVDPRTAAIASAFARAGFVALVYWSPATRELRLDPGDLPLLRAAYEVLLAQPCVDPGRSGLMGVCVGGSFALIAAGDPAIAKRIAFVAVHAPFASLRTLATDIAGESRVVDGVSEPWPVDPLTWQVYVRSVTDSLPPAEAERLRAAFEPRIRWNADRTMVVRSPAGAVDAADLSSDGRAVLALLGAGSGDVERALRALAPALRARLAAMSPLTHVARVRAPLILLLHDRDDHLIPVSESRRLWAALDGRPGAHYTELGLRHLRIPRGWSPMRIAREMARGYFAWYPLFRATGARRQPRSASRKESSPC